ncbi:MAG: type 3 dihydrofolate reductase [Vicinamibacterales bacterium]
MTPVVTLVVAAAEGGVIGKDGAIPWHLPADLAHFKRVTMGKPIVMGRKTFQSIGRALPGRLNVVVTRDRAFRAEGAVVTHSFEEALAACGDAPEVMVIGGGELYAAAMPMARRIHFTRVHAVVDGDTIFPALDDAVWQESSREERDVDERNPHAMTFVVLERRLSG